MDFLFVFDEVGYTKTFRSLEGPVGQDLARRANTIIVLGSYQAGYDTGLLVSSLDSIFYRDSDGDLGVRVGVNPALDEVGYALFHHEGTTPHPIAARRAKYLRFPDRQTGVGYVFRKSVYHPGTKPNPYLTQPLREVI